MALDSSELERLADDMYKDRLISSRRTYCGRCGYNLHTLPYVYTCPECGNRYNARPLSRKGIFSPHDVRFPKSELLLTLLYASVTVAVLLSAVISNPPDVWRFIMGAAFGVLTLVYSIMGYRRLIRYLNARMVARRITMQEDL